jgi:Zn-dependent metalloprotease
MFESCSIYTTNFWLIFNPINRVAILLRSENICNGKIPGVNTAILPLFRPPGDFIFACQQWTTHSLIEIPYLTEPTMCNTKRNPIHCIVPPYIADKLVDQPQVATDDALDNLLRDHRFRSDREFFSKLPKAAQEIMAIQPKPAPDKPVIEIYTCGNDRQLPGQRMRAADIQHDKDARNVLAASEATWEFYNRFFNRRSIDNANMALVHSIHYGRRYHNAMWNGRQMVYGDGDGVVFDSFTTDIDIIGHELAHGVVQFTVNLEYENQSGALNESFADVFGIMIKQFVLNQTADKSNWLIGENVMKGAQYALRSMIAPGTAYRNHPNWGDDPQPATMDNYVQLPNTYEGDWGGVHYNSGIPNFAFTQACLAIGGYTWENVGKVWYAALTETLAQHSTFAETKAATLDHAKRLFGAGSRVEVAVKKGWDAAKV